MSIYTVNDSGTSPFHSRFTKSISNKMRYDCQFHQLIPVLKRFCLPGDVWRVKGQALVRFLPMVSPSMTPYELIVRYFFVPLRQVEENTELIITGSIDGHLYTSELPEFPNFLKDAKKATNANAFKVLKHKFWDYMNVQLGDYENIKDQKCLPALYWWKAYCKIWFDYYRDENYYNFSGDFEAYLNLYKENGADHSIFYSNLKKDYFTSALPWQLKGVAPTLDVTGSASFTPNYTEDWGVKAASSFTSDIGINKSTAFDGPFKLQNTTTDDEVDQFNERILALLNQTQNNAQITGLGFNADEFRVMMQQTRIFERLARCGSRYTEYLYSNFGTAPADETLQRPKYLGGWKIPIVTSEVLQTAEDGSTPVGTMRGHGISRGGNGIKDFYCKEFGMIFGIAEVRPKVEYTTGIPRQLTYKSRFDFFNPSFQHLSEQEVRNGELFVDTVGEVESGVTVYKNDETLGFQAYANELRSYNDEVVGDMRGSLAYWGSALQFTSRPNVAGLINAGNHFGSFNAPFVNNDPQAYNIIVQFYNDLDVYRPMVRYSTPGLVDHF